MHLSRLRAFARVVSVLGVVGLSLAFLPAASAQVTPPPTTVDIGGNGSTITNVAINGNGNVAVVAPGSSNTITATLTMPDLGNGNIYTAPIGLEGAASPFSNCPYGFGSGGSTDTATANFTAPSTAGIYNIRADLGPNLTCSGSWHPSGQATIAVLVVTSFSSVCSLAESYSTDPAVAAGLCDKLAAAENAADRGNAKAASNILNAFGHEVAAQTGKALTSDQADTLMTLVSYLYPTT